MIGQHMTDDKLVSYRHKDQTEDDHARFVQYEKDKLPDWAADVQPYEEELIDEC